MSLLTILRKGLQAMIDEATTPESFKIGEQFENYIRDNLFIDRYYDLIERTHNYRTNQHDYVLSSMRPDFTFRDRMTRKEIYVEAKFRTGLYQGKVEWCKDKQLLRYLEFNRERPTFLLLGMGNNPQKPNFVALVPMVKARYTGLFPSFLKGFEIHVDEPVSSKKLWAKF